MAKRRRATVAASSAVVASAAAVPASADDVATQTFESNLKFLAETQSQRRTAPSASSTAATSYPSAAASSSSTSSIAYLSNSAVSGNTSKLPMMRTAAGKKWVDNKLAEFDPESYYCIFVGDLGNECTDEHLITAFSKYPSFQKARVVVDQLTKKNKGYGFVAFKEAADYLAAMREMNGKYVGNRPVKLRKGTWDKRADVEGLNNLNKKLVRDKQQQQQKK